MVFRAALLVECVDLEPAVVERVARRPDDGGDAGFRQVELEDRVFDAFGIRTKLAGFRFFG